MSRTSYPPTDYTAVLSAMRGLTTEFGMGSGDPSLYGSAHTRHSPYMNLIYEVIRLRIFAHPEGYIALWVKITNRKEIIKIKSSTNQYCSPETLTSLTAAAYQPRSLQGVLPKRELILKLASHLDAFSGYPFRTQLSSYAVGQQLLHQRFVHPGPLVLGAALLNSLTPAEDRDRTVSRRSEPSSRTALNGEQPYPWDQLQPQDAMSRHRGAKPCRRCGLLGKISLLSPEYLLSVERRPFHSEPPDHQNRLSSLLDLQVSQSSLLILLYSTIDCQPI